MPQNKNIVGDLGTTKIASDSYDIDNIYLTDEGWVYRHFKSTDGSRYWDEIIVAGEVPAGSLAQATNPPKLGTVGSPTSGQTGDGTFDFQYSSHKETGSPDEYTDKVETEGGGPGVGGGLIYDSGDIGEIELTAPNAFSTVLKGVPHTFTASVEDPTGVTFTWTTSDGDGVLSSTTGASVDVTWQSKGTKLITVTANKPNAEDDGRQKTYIEDVREFTLGTVSIEADDTRIPQVTIPGGSSVSTELTVNVEGKNVNDVTYAWSCTSANASDLVFKDDTSEREVRVCATSLGTYDIQCVVSSAKAGGVSGDGSSPTTVNVTLEAYPVTTLAPVSITGQSEVTVGVPFTLTANTDGNIPEDKVTYKWTYNTAAGGYSFESENGQKTITITTYSVGNYQWACMIGTTLSQSEDPNFDNMTMIKPRFNTESQAATGTSSVVNPDVTLNLTGANGAASYITSEGNNGSVSIQVGGTLTINNNSGGHPVAIVESDGGASTTQGTISGDNPAGNGETIVWDTTGATPGTYYYQCQSHAGMIGQIIVTS